MDSKQITIINKKSILISFILILISLIFTCISSYIDRDKSITPLNYRELINTNQDKENEYVSINITSIFPIKKNNFLNYYFVSDKNNNLYIARLNKNTYQKLEDSYKKDATFSYELKGYIFKISSDIKKTAITSYNETYGSEILSDNNFYNYVGNCYIDESRTPYSNISMFLIMSASVLIVISLLLIIVFIINLVKSKINLRKYNINEIKNELDNINILKYENLFLTDKYIISNLMGLRIFTYDNFVWLYNEKRKILGISFGMYLKGITTNKKVYYLGYTKEKNEIFKAAMDKAYLKNNHILIGKTKENKEKYTKYLKSH